MTPDAVSLDPASQDHSVAGVSSDWTNNPGGAGLPADGSARRSGNEGPGNDRPAGEQGDREEEEDLVLPSSGSAEPGPDGEAGTPVDRADMSGLTKAAVFILSLKEEAASSVLRCLSDEELSLVAAEIAQIGVVDKETVGAVLGQFVEIREASEIVYEGGFAPASHLLQSSLPAHRASHLTELLTSNHEREGFAFLSEVDAASLVACLEDERPQTIAVVLAQMNSTRAADVLERLPDDQRKQVIRRIASLDGTSEECLRLIEDVLRKHLEGARFSFPGDRGGVKAAAEILRAAEEQGTSSFLDDLREEKPELADEVSKYLFDFNDLARFDDRYLVRALARVDMRDLALALKNSDPKLAGKISRNLSRRSADELREAGEGLGPVRLSEVETARSLVLEKILSLDDGVRPLTPDLRREG